MEILGFMLPQLIKRTKGFWKVSLIGFLFTLLIEVLQLLLKRGIFEPDDLLGNTVGAMIGYGIFCMFAYFIQKRKKEDVPKIHKVLICQLPLVIVIGAFATLFLVYQTKELGNMPSTCIMRQKNIEVSCEEVFSDVTDKAMVYKASVMTTDETRKIALNLFEKLGCGIDESRTDIYENTALYYSLSNEDEGNRYSIWVEYDGGVFRFTDFNKGFQMGSDISIKEDATEEEVKSALEKMGVYVPEGVTFERGNEGEYIFSADRLEANNKMYDGNIRCTFYEDGTLGSVDYELLTMDRYKEVEIISEGLAYEQIQEGIFSYFRANEDMLKVEITGVKLGYELDTKGFYQPVYQFEAKVNDYDTQIIVPAIK